MQPNNTTTTSQQLKFFPPQKKTRGHKSKNEHEFALHIKYAPRFNAVFFIFSGPKIAVEKAVQEIQSKDIGTWFLKDSAYSDRHVDAVRYTISVSLIFPDELVDMFEYIGKTTGKCIHEDLFLSSKKFRYPNDNAIHLIYGSYIPSVILCAAAKLANKNLELQREQHKQQELKRITAETNRELAINEEFSVFYELEVEPETMSAKTSFCCIV